MCFLVKIKVVLKRQSLTKQILNLLLTERVLNEAEPTTVSETSPAMTMTVIVTAEMVTADDWPLLSSGTCCGSQIPSPLSWVSGDQEGPGLLCLTRWPMPTPPIWSSCSQSCHQTTGPMGLLPPAQAWEATACVLSLVVDSNCSHHSLGLMSQALPTYLI